MVYDPKAFIPHAASLRQAFAHCGRFPTAASRRSVARISVPLWLVVLSDQLPIEALVGHYPANWLMGRGLLLKRQVAPASETGPEDPITSAVLAPLSRSYSPLEDRLSTRYSPVRH